VEHPRLSSVGDDVARHVAFEGRQIGIAIERQAEKVLRERTVVGQDRASADKGAELFRPRDERRQQLQCT
jgi:hypothetical protein